VLLAVCQECSADRQPIPLSVVSRYHIKLVADRLQACSFRLEHIPKVVRFDGGGIDKRWEGIARTDEAFDIEADVRPYAQALPENKGAASKAIAGSLLPPPAFDLYRGTKRARHRGTC
jgi:hypothetical protein